MTETAHAAEVRDEIPWITIPAEGQPLEFPGELLREKSTERPQVQRWTVLRAYKFKDGSGRYIFSSVGRSVRYHAHASVCNQGVPTHTSSDTWTLDAEPCPVCKPADWRTHPGEYELETDNYTTIVCRDADDFLKKLRQSDKNRGHRPPEGEKEEEVMNWTLSGPAQQLLEMLCEVDEDIARAARKPRRVKLGREWGRECVTREGVTCVISVERSGAHHRRREGYQSFCT